MTRDVRTDEDITQIVDFLIAACCTGDDALFSGFITWTADIVTARGVSAATFRRQPCFQPSTFWVSNRNEHLRCQRLLLAATIRPRRQEEFGDRPPTKTMTYYLTISTAARSTSVRIAGDLDYQTTDDLVEVASQLLARQNTMRDLHLDFSELTFLDSAALSGLLTLDRRASQAGVALHLDHRPQFLDRVLQVTGLFEHFNLSRSDAETGDPNLLSQASSGESRTR